MFLARLLLGAGESVAYPCYSRVFAELPQEHRGRANALIDAGTKLGPAMGAFVGGLLLVHFGWRVLFVVLGAGGVLWLLPWLALMPRGRGASTRDVAALPSILQLLGKKCAWGSFLGHFCGNYFFYFLLAWLPNYLVGEEKMSIGSMSRLTSAVFLLIAASTLLVGGISGPADRRRLLADAGAASGGGGRTRRGVESDWAAGCRPQPALSLAIMAVACVGYGAFASNHWAITQTLAGPAMAGRWSSLQNGVANLAGIVAPWVTGLIVEFTVARAWRSC